MDNNFAFRLFWKFSVVIIVSFFLDIGAVRALEIKEGKIGKMPSQANSDSDNEIQNVLWFGHSLLRFPEKEGNPPLDIPETILDLHMLARSEAGTSNSLEKSIGFIEGPFHLGYWLDEKGQAENKLKSFSNSNIRYVVGIGFMHMLGQRGFDFPNITDFLERYTPIEAHSPRTLTTHKYRFIELVNRLLPRATWVNYIGPAFANNTAVQESINSRFECIRLTASEAGIKVINVPVGPAFRLAEQRALSRKDLYIRLQQSDNLHLTAQGGLLASYVLFATLYEFNVANLPVPQRYQESLGGKSHEKTVEFLKSIAIEMVEGYRPKACSESLMLPNDRAGLKLLLQSKQQ